MSKKSIKQTSKRLRNKRKSDFRATNDINDAVFGNLLKSVKGTKKSLTKSQTRNLHKLDKLEQNLQAAGKRTERNIGRHEAKMGSFGGMLSGVYSKQRAAAGAATKSGVNMAKAGQKQGSDIAQVGQDVIGIAKQGVREAQAGADYMASQGDNLRRSEDIKFVAQMRHDEEMAKLQAKLAEEAAIRQSELMKKQTRFEAGVLEKQIGSQAFQSVRPFAEMLTSAATVIMRNRDMDLAEALVELDRVGVVSSANPGETDAATMLFKRLHADNQTGIDDIAEEIAYVMRTGVPGWESMGKGKKDQLVRYIERNAKSTQASYAAGDYQSSSSDSSGLGGFIGDVADDAFGSPLNIAKTAVRGPFGVPLAAAETALSKLPDVSLFDSPVERLIKKLMEEKGLTREEAEALLRRAPQS